MVESDPDTVNPSPGPGRRSADPLEGLILALDRALRAVAAGATPAHRPSPAAGLPEPRLEPPERVTAARLMRVNHAGEVCAQALYHGQELTARSPQVRERMRQAAEEEGDHLAWCAERTAELGGRPSLLNPLWYGASLLTGVLWGLAGDRWSLGFLSETERQVEGHLDHHLERLPRADTRSRAILSVMKEDEARHGQEAREAGGAELPAPLRRLMHLQGRLMTTLAYWV